MERPKFSHRHCSTFLSILVGPPLVYYTLPGMKGLEVPTVLKIGFTATITLCFVLYSIASKTCDSLCFLAITCTELALSQNCHYKLQNLFLK